MTDTIRDINRRNLDKRNSKLLEVIKDNKYVNVRTLTEVNFIKFFLPYFSGKVAVTKEVIDAWGTIAGELDRPVDLIDAAGQIVARVPPVVSVDAYVPIVTRRVGIHHELERSTKGSMPMGENYMYAALTQRLEQMYKQGDKSQQEKQWVTFLKRYGIDVDTAAAPTGNDPDDLEYEY